MTRLTEALERARAVSSGQDVVTTTASEESVPDLPSVWQFGETPVVVPQQAETPSLNAVPIADQPQAAKPPSSMAGKLVTGEDANKMVVEQYRRLASVFHHAQRQAQTRVIMISSAAAAEGKTLTAVNLALTLSDSYGKRVLLIDADLRRPSSHLVFGVNNDVGLSTVLREPLSRALPVHQVSPSLWLLPAGVPDPNPMSSLTSEAMKQLLLDAAEQFDWVVVDTPPLGLMADANLLAAMVDAAVVVVSAGSTPYPLINRAIDAIGRQKVLGVVLNRAHRAAFTDGDGYYGYYYDGYERESKPARRFFGRG